MNEFTANEQVEVTPDEFFDDVPESTDEGTEEETSPKETTEESKEESTDETDESEVVTEEEVARNIADLEFKFLKEKGKVGDMSDNEIVEAIEIGKNAQRFRDKYNESSEKLNRLATIGDKLGYDGLEGLSEALLTVMAKNISEEQNRNEQDVIKEFNEGYKSREQRMIDSFVEKFPDVKIEDVPESVLQSYQLDGKDLSTSYAEHLTNQKVSEKDAEVEGLKQEIEKLQQQLSIDKTNNNNKKTSVVKKTQGGDDSVKDDFLGEFL